MIPVVLSTYGIATMPSDFDELFAAAPSHRDASMHSHDRTMLSALGFADADKKNPEHDRICHYLAAPETVKKLGGWLGGMVSWPGSPFEVVPDGCLLDAIRFERRELTGRLFRASSAAEFHLTKGTGQYQSTVGFIDVAYECTIGYEFFVTHRAAGVSRSDYFAKFDRTGEWAEVPREPNSPPSWSHYADWKMFAEVKVDRVSVGDVLRQLNLYKSFFFSQDSRSKRVAKIPLALLVAPWDISASEKIELEKAGFAFIKLGEDYQKWAAADAGIVARPNLTL